MSFVAVLFFSLCLLGSASAVAQEFRPLESLGGNLGGGGGVFGGGNEDQKVTVTAQFTAPANGEPGQIFITAKMEENWHIYSTTQPPGGPVATKITLEPSPSYRLSGGFTASQPPKRETYPEAFGDLPVESHYGEVTWYAPLLLAEGVDPLKLEIEGKLKAQPCDPKTCLAPRDFPFTARLGPGVKIQEPAEAASPPAVPAEPPSQLPPTAVPAEPPTKSIAGTGDGLPWQWYDDELFDEHLQYYLGPEFSWETTQKYLEGSLEETSFWWVMLLAFGGGLLLNLMPCVLPVIGLKILSFVEQAGENRTRALMLNVWYSIGLISVFMVLATLAVFLNVGWGHLFKYPAFNIVMATIIFVMGLSFLGVWEIPIPGFVGTGKAAELGEKEGFSGAFSKGVVTTILATPCTGPGMAAALAWAVRQPAGNTYAVFAAVGLGMASPYLLVGAFPRLIRFLPKPGAWMETFKQVMGFILMATVVYIFTFIDWPYVVPTIGLLFACWAACWWFARTPATADSAAKSRAWLEGLAFIGVAWLLLFPGLDEIVAARFVPHGLYDEMAARFEKRVGTGGEGPQLVGPPGGRTVMVDFTADWCPTCKTLEATVLNTQRVEELVAENDVVCMTADMTRENPRLTEILEDHFLAAGVPVLAIFPAGDPNRPIVFREGYLQGRVLEALRKAGPSITQQP